MYPLTCADSAQVGSVTPPLLALLAPRLSHLTVSACFRIGGLSVLNFVHLRSLAMHWATAGEKQKGPLYQHAAAAHAAVVAAAPRAGSGDPAVLPAAAASAAASSQGDGDGKAGTKDEPETGTGTGLFLPGSAS